MGKKAVSSYARGYALKLKEQHLKIGMGIMLEVEKVLKVGGVGMGWGGVGCTSGETGHPTPLAQPSLSTPFPLPPPALSPPPCPRRPALSPAFLSPAFPALTPLQGNSNATWGLLNHLRTICTGEVPPPLPGTAHGRPASPARPAAAHSRPASPARPGAAHSRPASPARVQEGPPGVRCGRGGEGKEVRGWVRWVG